jgi:hypothetical protein
MLRLYVMLENIINFCDATKLPNIELLDLVLSKIKSFINSSLDLLGECCVEYEQICHEL